MVLRVRCSTATSHLATIGKLLFICEKPDHHASPGQIVAAVPVQSSYEAVLSSPDLSTRFLLRSPMLLAKLGVSRFVRLSTPLPGFLECLSDPCEPSKPTSSRIRAHTFACSRSRNVYGCFARSLRLSLASATHVFGYALRRSRTHPLRAFIFSVLSSRKFGCFVSVAEDSKPPCSSF
jgi:hypothetical protein